MSTPFNHKKVDEFKNLLQEFDKIVIDFTKLQKLKTKKEKDDVIKKTKEKTNKFLNDLNKWWTNNFVDSSDGLILFGDEYANNKSIELERV